VICQASLVRCVPTTLFDTTPPQARTRPTTKRATQAVIGRSRVAHHHDCISYVARITPTTALNANSLGIFLYLARTAYGSPHISWHNPASRTTLTTPRRETLHTSYSTRSYGILAGRQAPITSACTIVQACWLCEWPLHVSSHTCLNSHSPDTPSWKPRTKWSQLNHYLRLSRERRRRNCLEDSQYSTPLRRD
jgi:hypothetical protein